MGQYATRLPLCLSRFLDYPPGPGKLGFPRGLFQNPFPANPDFWLKDLDFSCASPWSDQYGNLRAGTAISRRHVISAKHFPLAAGTRIAFVGVNGDVSHYSIKATKALAEPDIMIGLLDYELTPDVHPAKVLPPNYEKWLTHHTYWPVVTLNQHERTVLTELVCISNAPPRTMILINGRVSREEQKKFSGCVVLGDSGSPAFMLYKGKPILLYCIMASGPGFGPMIHENRQEVQRAMDDLCPGYKLDEFDFTGP